MIYVGDDAKISDISCIGHGFPPSSGLTIENYII
jgi:hypothetical protein